MSDSKLVGTSSSERTLDERDLSSLRPAKQNAPRPRKPRREPTDQSLIYVCSNKNCDHTTWEPHDQARHMAQEFWWAAKALVALAPESPEALKLTGGVMLADLTDDECREAYAAWSWHQRVGDLALLPATMRLRHIEYLRRQKAGTLSPAGPRPKRDTCPHGHPYTEENTYTDPHGRRRCRTCMKLSWQKPDVRQQRRERDRARWKRLKENDPEAYVRRLEKMRRYHATTS